MLQHLQPDKNQNGASIIFPNAKPRRRSHNLAMWQVIFTCETRPTAFYLGILMPDGSISTLTQFN
jgi:hypothetical protein